MRTIVQVFLAGLFCGLNEIMYFIVVIGKNMNIRTENTDSVDLNGEENVSP